MVQAEVTLIMPGSRHYGSWLYSHYDTGGRIEVLVPDKQVPCRYCGGTGLW